MTASSLCREEAIAGARGAVRIETTLAEDDWDEDGAALVAFLTGQGYNPSPVESELMGTIVPTRASEAPGPEDGKPSSQEDVIT